MNAQAAKPEIDAWVADLFSDLLTAVGPIWSTQHADLPDALESAIFGLALLTYDQRGGGGYLMMIEGKDAALIWAALVDLYKQREDLQATLRCIESHRMFENKYTGDHIEFVW